MGLVMLAIAAPVLRAVDLGMQISGEVRTREGPPCAQCEVVAVGDRASRTYRARTDSNGRFVLIGLPADRYGLIVVGPDGHIALTEGADNRVIVQEGVNLSGVSLVAPPPAPSLEEILAPESGPPPEALAAPRAAGPTPQVAAPAPTRAAFGCGQPEPAIQMYRGREAFAVTRGNDSWADDAKPIICAKNEAYGCETPFSDVIPRTGAPARPDCSLDGKINLPTIVFNTVIVRHKSTWPFYDPEPPNPQGCSKIRASDCGGYHSFSGIDVHECTHRTGDEKAVDAAFKKYLDKIKQIQSEIDQKGACYLCCLERLPEADKAQANFLAKIQDVLNEGPGNESSARAAECAFYKQRYGGLCK